MFKTIELCKNWTIKKELLPDLTDIEYIEQSVICLSNSNDSLQATVNREEHNDDIKYYMSLIDISGNKISYIITEEDFNESKELIGKSLDKKVYLLPSTSNPTKTLQLCVFKRLNIIIANYYANNMTELNDINKEDWFDDEILDIKYNDNELFNRNV